MADLAAFQAVEGSYNDAVIDASVTLPPGEIGFEVLAIRWRFTYGENREKTRRHDNGP